MKNKANLIDNFGTKKWFVVIILILLLTDVAIFLNIPFLREIFGFLFLTLLPGLLILQVLKLNKIGLTEKLVLAVGLSISFLMFFGLLLNNSSIGLGYKSPLSTVPLLISLNIAAIALTLIAYQVNKNTTFSLPHFSLNTSEKIFLIVPILFPALSIFGAYFMNTTNNNIVSVFLLFLIPIYVIVVCFFNQKFPARVYPLIIFLISISLILMRALRSNHLLGIDTHVEYHFFQTTLNNMHWGVFGHSTLDACLSISLLPTIYRLFLNANPEIFFNVFYVILFSLTPLIIFVISKKYVGDFYGFLASIFFMFQAKFIFAAGSARTTAAIFFFGLAMMTLFSDKIDPLKKRILFIIFMASCIVSHYSTTYIFFFIMLGAFVGMEILSKKYTFKKVVSLTSVILFFSIIFFWYSQVTETAFNAGVNYIGSTIDELNRFFVTESRGESTQALLGKDITQKGIPHKIEFALAWLIFAFIGVGIITSIKKYKEMSLSELNLEKPDFLKEKFEVGYFMIALACAGLLAAMVALPFISAHYGMDRLYAVAITILSVFFVIGGIIVAKYLDKLLYKKKIVKNKREIQAYVIILLVLIPYFFCVTGVMYNLFGYPRAITLNSEGKQYNMSYVHDQESYGAKWISHRQQNLMIYADHGGSLRLTSQGEIGSHSIFKHKKMHDGYIYLRYHNLVADEFVEAYGEAHNMTEYSDIFVRKSKIYDNGGSLIYW
ncbi:MAG: hypothetical protein CHKLHMKO_00055 [Candidatus Argoarchaeum ethanivorans]|uniref:DUF2206 domain-containing protein n=1 Tax=Candidatus Argoarchaeum ethanivorans TaxID=2608793 RepID=A0A811T416_9EURY|nr:MAG: hypothetical protein CHKLHMKO_00055 [Candidatus Argoarchaeum ethanivorans]